MIIVYVVEPKLKSDLVKIILSKDLSSKSLHYHTFSEPILDIEYDKNLRLLIGANKNGLTQV